MRGIKMGSSVWKGLEAEVFVLNVVSQGKHYWLEELQSDKTRILSNRLFHLCMNKDAVEKMNCGYRVYLSYIKTTF